MILSGVQARRYPNVRMAAEIAQEAGWDFRVLVLHRSAQQLLVSTVTHRHFASWNTEAVVRCGARARCRRTRSGCL